SFADTGVQHAASLSVTSSTSTTFAGQLALTGGASLAAGGGDVKFLNGLTTGAAATFSNTGLLQLGDNAADASNLTGALTHTAGATTLGGTVAAGSVALGGVTLAADTMLDTSAANGSIQTAAIDATAA